MGMLLLTRRVGESLYIDSGTDEPIIVTILGTKGNQVRIGTQAPKSVAVHRLEVAERIRKEKVKELLEKLNEKEVC